MIRVSQIIILLLISLNTIAQQWYVDNYFLDIIRFPVNHKEVYGGIEGSPYTNKEFTAGKIVLRDSSEISPIELRYDWYAKEMEIKLNNELLILPKDNKIIYIAIGNVNYMPFYYAEDINGFLVLSYSGKSLLLKKEIVEFLKEKKAETITSEYKPPRFRWSHPQYYIIINNEDFKPLLLQKKKIILAFPEASRESLSTYIKTEKLSFKKETEIIKLVEYFDSLNL